MTTETNSTPSVLLNSRSGWYRLTVFTGLLCLIGLAWWILLPGPGIPSGISERNYKLAAIRFEGQFKRTPNHFDTLMMAGELAVQKDDSATAIAAFSSVPDEHPEYGPKARLQEALVLVRQQQARQSELSFWRFLQLAETNPKVSQQDVVEARQWLCFLLSVELRLDERKEILAAAHDVRQINVADSKQFYFPRLLIWKSSSGRRRLMEFLEKDPGDFLLNVALGRYLTGEGKLDEARTLLESLMAQVPGQPDCTIALLECCFEQDDWKAIAAIISTQPDYQTGEPHELTRSRGELALHERRWEGAVTDFTRALKSDLSDPAVNMGLAKALSQLGRRDEQVVAQHRSLVLSQIRVNMARNNESSPDALLDLAERCREIEMPMAAETFEWHSQRIKQQVEGDGVSE